MEEHKYKCALCGQIVTPLPDGSCPICGAPKEMLKPYIDEDEEQQNLRCLRCLKMLVF